MTKHLHVLRDAGLVTRARVGRESRFSLVAGPLEDARDDLSRASAQWDAAIERLRKHVEE